MATQPLARWELLDSSSSVSYHRSPAFDQLNLGLESRPLTNNSVLLIPNVLNPDERKLLIDAAEERTAAINKPHCPKLRLAILKRCIRGTDGGVPGGLGSEAAAVWFV